MTSAEGERGSTVASAGRPPVRPWDLVLVPLVAFAGGAGAMAAAGFLVGAAASFFFGYSDEEARSLGSGERFRTVSIYLTFLAICLSGVLYVLVLSRLRGHAFSQAFFAPVRLRWLFTASGAAVLLIGTFGALANNLPPRIRSDLELLNSGMMPSSPLESWLFAVVALFAAPFAEEIYFRGILFGWLRSRLSFLAAGSISAVLFAGAHGFLTEGLALAGLLATAQLAVLGLAAAWFADRTGSLWPAVTLHGANNAIVLTAMAIAV